MIAGLAQLTSIGETMLLGGFLVFLRVGAAMSVLPALGEQMIPLRVRLGAALALSLVVYPLVSDRLALSGQFQIARLAGVEVIAGLVMGIGLRLFVHALQIAGAIAAQAVSLSQLLGPSNADPVPALGQVLVLGGLTVALLAGLHVTSIEYIALSYELIPPAGIPDPEILASWGIARIAKAFGLAFGLAGPFVLASLIYNVALGAINRAMPQLMVAFVGAPAITAAGLGILLLSGPLILRVWADDLRAFMFAPGLHF